MHKPYKLKIKSEKSSSRKARINYETTFIRRINYLYSKRNAFIWMPDLQP